MGCLPPRPSAILPITPSPITPARYILSAILCLPDFVLGLGETDQAIYTDSYNADGEGQFEAWGDTWTDSIPPNTIGISQTYVSALDRHGEERVEKEAKTMVISLFWKQDVEPLTGDLDRDGDVDFDDFFIFVDNERDLKVGPFRMLAF